MTRYLLITTLILIACSDHKNDPPTMLDTRDSISQTRKDTIIKKAHREPPFIKSDLFVIAKIAFHRDWLERIFVVIKPEQVNDTSLIRQTLCILKKSYPLEHSNVSFFSDKKYADYKDELFFNDRKTLPESEYRNWMNTYYLGEFNFDTRVYETFPVSNFHDRQKVFKLKSCP